MEIPFLIELMFFAIFVLMIVAINPIKLLKMHNADIIEIRDIEMLVSSKNINRREDGPDSYHVRLVGVENRDKKASLNSRQAYRKYKVGDIIIMQEVVYKNNNEILSAIKYATDRDYERLNSYKSQNQVGNEVGNLDFATELEITEYHKSQNKINNIISLVSVVIFIYIFVTMMNLMR